jgi:hydroxyacylglutathione hydrolase
LTHCHSDHAGGAHYFHEEYDVPICGGHMTAQRVSSGEERLLGLDIARPEGVYPPDYKFAATPVSVVFKDGDDLTIGECGVQVLETPGHSSDSTCYLVTLAEGVALFGGDTLRTDDKIPLLNMFDSELAAYRGSVKRLAGQSFDALYPGHGIFVLSGARRVAEELDQQLSHSIYLPGVIS